MQRLSDIYANKNVATVCIFAKTLGHTMPSKQVERVTNFTNLRRKFVVIMTKIGCDTFEITPDTKDILLRVISNRVGMNGCKILFFDSSKMREINRKNWGKVRTYITPKMREIDDKIWVPIVSPNAFDIALDGIVRKHKPSLNSAKRCFDAHENMRRLNITL